VIASPEVVSLRRLSPWRFAAVALVTGLILIAITPPFEVPDETGHFIRAYAISELQWRCVPQGRFAVVTVPASIQKIANVLIDDIPGHPDRKFRFDDLRSTLRVPLNPQAEFAVPCGGPALYTPVPYIAEAGAIAAARIFTLPGVVLFYLARFVNLLVSLAVLFVAYKIAPFFRSVIAIVAMLPMALFLRSSCSPDAIIFSLAALVFAAGLRLAFSPDGDDTRRNTFVFLIAAFFLVLAKAVYFPLPFVVFIAAPTRRRWSLLGATTIVTAAGATMSLLAAHSVYTPLRPDVAIDTLGQVDYVKSHPITVAKIVLSDYVIHAPRYAAHLIGRLGWLDTPIPPLFLLLFGTLLFVAACTDGDALMELTLSQRFYVLALITVVLGLVAISQYLLWTPVGAPYVDGIQGRYFLPIAPLFLLLFYRQAASRMKETAVLASSVVMAAVCIAVLIRRFY
jgi:uncharacterized membrane protein